MRPRRPVEETQALQQQVLDGLAQGLTVSQIHRQNPKIRRDQIARWQAESPEFRDAYARAREQGLERMADEILEISDDVAGDAARDRLRVDSRKWLLARLMAQR